MGMSELTHSKRWKSTMNYFYSIGASVVLLGALFKLQHWPMGGLMLTIGMSCEALIFFLSAFEPMLENPDWTKVYPQLKEDFLPEDEYAIMPTKTPAVGFDSVLEKAEISPELLAKLKKGLQDLSNTATGIADISSATLATDVYVRNLNSASESMNVFTDVNSRAAHSIEKSLGDLVHSYEHSSQVMSTSSKAMAEQFADSTKKINEQLSATGEKLSTSYKEFSDTINKDFATLNDSSKNYSGELAKMNSSLASLNSSYEIHLQSVKKLADSSTKAHTDYAAMSQLIDASLAEADKYRKQTEQLNRNLEALNQVYGNMLGAMNIKG